MGAPELLAVPASAGTTTSFSSLGWESSIDASPAGAAFAALASALDLDPAEAAERVRGIFVTANYWPLLGVKPALGRFFTTAEDQLPQGTPVAVIAYGYWQSQYGGAFDVLGKAVRIGRSDYTIIGVTPPGFEYPAGARLYVPVRVRREADVVVLRTPAASGVAITAEQLASDGLRVRVVSMPCTSVFDAQDADYRASVLPAGVPRVPGRRTTRSSAPPPAAASSGSGAPASRPSLTAPSAARWRPRASSTARPRWGR